MIFVLNCKLSHSCSPVVYNGYLRHATPTSMPTVAVFNKITYLYIVGVEGVGHHGVLPAIAKIGEACNHFVIYEHKLLRSYQNSKNDEEFHSILEVSKRVGSTSKHVLVVEDSSFPSGNSLRISTHAEKRELGKYDLYWIYDHITQVKDIDVKFLYLNRDFYRTVASHPEYDGGFEPHARVIHDFIGYLGEEYQLISRHDNNIWKQISYEWFLDMKDCPKLVSALADFIGLGSCNIEAACASLSSTLKKGANKPVNTTEFQIAQNFDASLPIPFLEYHPD